MLQRIGGGGSQHFVLIVGKSSQLAGSFTVEETFDVQVKIAGIGKQICRKGAKSGT